MRTVGQILKEERLKKNFSLEQVERATKIRAKYLRAIESDDFAKMPTSPYIQGFIKNYSDYLGLRSTTILALFRRQFLENRKKSDLVEEPLIESSSRLTPNKVILALLVFLVMGMGGYFYRQYRILHEPPPLTVESPKDELVTKEDVVAMFGDTDIDATLTLNGEPLIIKDDGKFYKDVLLNIGNNTLTVEAVSRVGEKTTVVRRVTRLPVEENTP